MKKVSESEITRYLIEEVLLNFTGRISSAAQDEADRLLRRRTDKAVIYVGTGTCGIAAGADKTLAAVQEYIRDNNVDATVVEVGCIGLCNAEPLLDFQAPGKARICFRKATYDKIRTILNECFHNQLSGENILGQYRSDRYESWEGIPYIEDLPFFRYQKRILMQDCGFISPLNINEYIAQGGYRSFIKAILNYPPDVVCSLIEESGLRGRGGGGYPTAEKWKNVRTMATDQKYLICNADESDPGAYMERSLIEGNPHLLIEGIAIASYATGASKAFIHIRNEYFLAATRLKNAIQQAKEAGFLGENIFKSGFNLNIFLQESPGSFVCGEETALIKSLEGRRGMPRSKPPYPTEKGLFGKPTVVNNVETLINVPVILRHGPKWFNLTGHDKSRGTKLFSLSGDTVNNGVIEVPFGISIDEVIQHIGGGVRDNKTFKAVLIGGPSGCLIPKEQTELKIDYDLFEKENLVMGSGGMIVLDDGRCLVDLTKYFADFVQKESCGKCIPCREGTNRMFTILDNISKRPAQDIEHESLSRFRGAMQLEGLAQVIHETSLCGLGKTAANPVLSALKWFREEFEEHIFERKCRANVCKKLRTYVISAERCTGCTICLKKCPVDAITGSALQPHFILQDKCNNCGICFDVCKFSAIDVI